MEIAFWSDAETEAVIWAQMPHFLTRVAKISQQFQVRILDPIGPKYQIIGNFYNYACCCCMAHDLLMKSG